MVMCVVRGSRHWLHCVFVCICVVVVGVVICSTNCTLCIFVCCAGDGVLCS